ncbi:MAG TPA: hypothetical protein VKS82_02960 [Streptosporangiaceae bacterium]|nr:hypothetical protein [Streptosporangiaceae bacterium]
MTDAWTRDEPAAAWLRRGATALAAARTAIGLAALASPALIARPWVGAGAAKAAPGRVLGRALGGRDLALGLGALAALQRTQAGAPYSAGVWVGVAALADSFDVLATATAWDELPGMTRWLVAGSAAGSAAVGAVAAWSLIRGQPSAARPA